ncbi:FecR family protein [Chitinophaga agri]|uniref:FecR protein domain-containing protein n=1 Tax=Chitinophaga agri TaxID=2703787 RepID=A0A6B9ZF08_9BACT|nr:FecR family protein [Chitinophaga agri]QHS61022.1 hypothetical protein GWR21_15880 [Chitinophaga agri]
MDKGTLLLLLEKFRQGTCSPEEEALLYQWLDALDADDSLPALPAVEMQQFKKNMQQQIWPAISRTRRIGRRIATIAAVVVPLVIAGYFAQHHFNRSQRLPFASLSWRTIKNTSGQLQKVTLPDQSTAVVGPFSTIQYPVHFPDHARPVKISEGKAFFDVVKDDHRPFSVEDHNGIRTVVLGTSFTVEASSSMHLLRVAVASGKVQVEQKGVTAAVLGPSQRLTFSEQSIKKDSIAAADLLAWTNGKIILRNANLQELLLTIKYQYGITATTTLDISQGNYNLQIPATMTLQEVLDIIEKISFRPKIHFTMKEQKLFVN